MNPDWLSEPRTARPSQYSNHAHIATNQQNGKMSRAEEIYFGFDRACTDGSLKLVGTVKSIDWKTPIAVHHTSTSWSDSQKDALRDFLSRYYAPDKKETPMERTAVIKSRMAELEAELAEREKFGEDTFVDGSVLKFKVRFNGEKSYTYAAVKANDRWYLTGRSTEGKTWDALIDFLIASNVTKVWGMAKAVRLV